jgi:Ser/Thr protein kinase RdoA (MazF antagonist)
LTRRREPDQIYVAMQKQAVDISRVLGAWDLSRAVVSELGSGLINRTWLIESGPDKFVLQHVNRVFPAAINRDIDTLTRHLATKGLPTTRLVPTTDGGLWLDRPDGVWRLLTFIEGVSLDSLGSAEQAHAAGVTLARFHRAVDDLRITFANARLGVHDTARHLANLESALDEHRDHSRYAEVAGLGAEILAQAARLPELSPTPDRIVHGDPKINNLLFERGTDRALCLVDLDTLTRMPLPLELGDAMRSWCNPASEDNAQGIFAAEFFRPALQGYADEAAGWIEPDEWKLIVPATLTILVELAARFCGDALNESYFGWDPKRFDSRSRHNQVRAEGQLVVAKSLISQQAELENIVDSIFSA